MAKTRDNLEAVLPLSAVWHAFNTILDSEDMELYTTEDDCAESDTPCLAILVSCAYTQLKKLSNYNQVYGSIFKETPVFMGYVDIPKTIAHNSLSKGMVYGRTVGRVVQSPINKAISYTFLLMSDYCTPETLKLLGIKGDLYDLAFQKFGFNKDLLRLYCTREWALYECERVLDSSEDSEYHLLALICSLFLCAVSVSTGDSDGFDTDKLVEYIFQWYLESKLRSYQRSRKIVGFTASDYTIHRDMHWDNHKRSLRPDIVLSSPKRKKPASLIVVDSKTNRNLDKATHEKHQDQVLSYLVSGYKAGIDRLAGVLFYFVFGDDTSFLIGHELDYKYDITLIKGSSIQSYICKLPARVEHETDDYKKQIARIMDDSVLDMIQTLILPWSGGSYVFSRSDRE